MNKSRLAIIDPNKCKPTKCNHECKNICPVERNNKECVDIEDIVVMDTKKQIAKILESSCIGCGLCVKACPFDAIYIVNVPSEIGNFITHRYNENGFRLYKMPELKMGNIMGIIGANGSGKSSICSILIGKIVPNFEIFDKKIAIGDVIKKFKGSELQKYFGNLYKNKLRIVQKPQNIDEYKKSDVYVSEFIAKENDKTDEEIMKTLEIDALLNKKMCNLSGGELQRLLCASCIMKNADVYIFDEPSNFLDIAQRLKLSQKIRSLTSPDRYIIVIDHDLSILDYIADYITIVFGVPASYGTCSLPHPTGNAINMYFDGYLPAENIKFRTSEYKLKDINEIYEQTTVNMFRHEYPAFEIEYPHFKCKVKNGSFLQGANINIILGVNGSGKTSFVNHLSKYTSSEQCFAISVKEQNLDIEKYMLKNGNYPTVEELFYDKIRSAACNQIFQTEIMKPLNMKALEDRKLNELSGGELQRTLIVLCLGTEAQIYFIDEPSACLDIEQRVLITKIIKRFMMHNNKIAFVVEHDLLMAIAMAMEMNSQVIVASNDKDESTEETKVYNISSPMNAKEGIDVFLKEMNITVRLESQYAKHNRPRINKPESSKDVEQKKLGKYYM